MNGKPLPINQSMLHETCVKIRQSAVHSKITAVAKIRHRHGRRLRPQAPGPHPLFNKSDAKWSSKCRPNSIKTRKANES